MNKSRNGKTSKIKKRILRDIVLITKKKIEKNRTIMIEMLELNA